MGKDVYKTQQQCLTPPQSVTIIATLCAVEANEKKLARQVVCIQAAVALVVAFITYSLESSQLYATSVISGGAVSVLNGILLAWRMSRTARYSASEVHESSDAQRQLRLMYFYAAERFLVVIVLLALCMAALKLSPLAVLGGFVVGQTTLLAARLLLNRLNKLDSD